MNSDSVDSFATLFNIFIGVQINIWILVVTGYGYYELISNMDFDRFAILLNVFIGIQFNICILVVMGCHYYESISNKISAFVIKYEEKKYKLMRSDLGFIIQFFAILIFYIVNICGFISTLMLKNYFLFATAITNYFILSILFYDDSIYFKYLKNVRYRKIFGILFSKINIMFCVQCYFAYYDDVWFQICHSMQIVGLVSYYQHMCDANLIGFLRWCKDMDLKPHMKLRNNNPQRADNYCGKIIITKLSYMLWTPTLCIGCDDKMADLSGFQIKRADNVVQFRIHLSLLNYGPRRLINKIMMVNTCTWLRRSSDGTLRVNFDLKKDNVVLYNVYCIKMFLIKHLNICQDIQTIITRNLVPFLNKTFEYLTRDLNDHRDLDDYQ